MDSRYNTNTRYNIYNDYWHSSSHYNINQILDSYNKNSTGYKYSINSQNLEDNFHTNNLSVIDFSKHSFDAIQRIKRLCNQVSLGWASFSNFPSNIVNDIYSDQLNDNLFLEYVLIEVVNSKKFTESHFLTIIDALKNNYRYNSEKSLLHPIPLVSKTNSNLYMYLARSGYLKGFKVWKEFSNHLVVLDDKDDNNKSIRDYLLEAVSKELITQEDYFETIINLMEIPKRKEIIINSLISLFDTDSMEFIDDFDKVSSTQLTEEFELVTFDEVYDNNWEDVDLLNIAGEIPKEELNNIHIEMEIIVN